MTRIYADNAATTKMSRRATDAMVRAMRELGGNASSLHSSGRAAAEALFNARERIAHCLGCKPSEVYFTSGGTEGVNQAILSGAMNGMKRGKNHTITTAFEHHAVLGTVQRLKKYGYKITYIGVNGDGVVRPEDIEAEITGKTALVSVMAANNEIGTIQPIREIGEICKRHRVLFHTDAVQAAGQIPLNAEEIEADFLSLSAHKFQGPKGVGVLVARNRLALSSLMTGGRQEAGRRAGTENVPAIVAMAEALEESLENREKKNARILRMRERLIDGLLGIPGTELNGDRKRRLPGNVNVCFDGVEGEPLVLMLDTMGIEVSTGSACTAGGLDPSHVLLAIGRPDDRSNSAIRLTINEKNTSAEIETIISSVSDAVRKLREMA